MTASIPRKPIYLLADSQLLFWKSDHDPVFLESIRKASGAAHPLAAYIGASNGDDPSFYELFDAAMKQIAAGERRMIRTHLAEGDAEFLDRADIILLAGGSVQLGWCAFEDNGLKELLVRRYHEGVVLAGISAGAVQLGRGGLTESGSALLATFGLVPLFVGAHEERDDWASLRKAIALAGGDARGIGIPSGGGWSGPLVR